MKKEPVKWNVLVCVNHRCKLAQWTDQFLPLPLAIRDLEVLTKGHENCQTETKTTTV